jgi:HEPN domain-containing protein
LKALIVERGRRPARTHDLLELLNAAKSEGWGVEIPVDEAVYLNSIYHGRYPTEEGLLPHGEPTGEDARRALGAAAAIAEQVNALLKKA